MHPWDADNLTQNSYANNTIKEEIYSAYVQANFEGEIGGLETQTVVGLRYERTKVKSDAQQNAPEQIVWVSDNDFRSVFGADLIALHRDAEYSNWLPNIDFAVGLNDSMKVRASVSQTIARPQYNNLYMTTNVGGPSTPTALGGVARASSGNPSLEPLESFNLDLSFEWYYAESSYASIGFFRKAVNNFVGTGVSQADSVQSAGSDLWRAWHLDRRCSGGPGCPRLPGERAEPVHHGSRPGQSGRLPEWSG